MTKTIVGVSETLAWETKTAVAKPSTIFRLTRKMVSAVRKDFSFEKTMVCGIGTIVCAMHAIFTTSVFPVLENEIDRMEDKLPLLQAADPAKAANAILWEMSL
jgi:hypothetical protein